MLFYFLSLPCDLDHLIEKNRLKGDTDENRSSFVPTEEMPVAMENSILFVTPTHLISSGRHPVELGGGVSICPALQRDWLSCADVHSRGRSVGRDVRQAGVGPAPPSITPTERHHLPQFLANQVRWGGAEGDRGLQHLEV